jgi:hypothetical protein
MHTDVRINLEPAVRIAILLLFPVCVAKRKTVSGCRTNGQSCVACAQASCGSVFSTASSVKAAEFGQAVSDSA